MPRQKSRQFEPEIEEYLKLKSPSTAQSYGSGFVKFRKYYRSKYGKDATFNHFLNRIYEEFKKPPLEQKRIAEIEVSEFIDWLKAQKLSSGKKLSSNAIRLYFAAIQNYLKYRNVVISLSFISNIPAANGKKENEKHEWSIKQIKKFVDAAKSYRDKALIMCMFQSGLGENEICNLDYGDVMNELEDGILPLCLKLVRQKTQVQFKTFLGRDAVKYLKLYLETRGELKPEDPLFVKHRARGEERINVVTIEQAFNEIAKDLDFIKQNGGYNPARPHSLRAAFNSRLFTINETLREFWMGHNIGGVAKAYLTMPTEEMRKLYMGAEEFLKIERSSRDELDETAKSKSIASSVLAAEVKALEQKVKSLETLLNQLYEMKPEELRLLLQEIDRLLHQRQKDEDKKQFSNS
jgi:integrase